MPSCGLFVRQDSRSVPIFRRRGPKFNEQFSPPVYDWPKWNLWFLIFSGGAYSTSIPVAGGETCHRKTSGKHDVSRIFHEREISGDRAVTSTRVDRRIKSKGTRRLSNTFRSATMFNIPLRPSAPAIEPLKRNPLGRPLGLLDILPAGLKRLTASLFLEAQYLQKKVS